MELKGSATEPFCSTGGGGGRDPEKALLNI